MIRSVILMVSESGCCVPVVVFSDDCMDDMTKENS